MTTLPRSPGQKRILASLAGLPITPAGEDYLGRRGLLEVATDLGIGVVPDSPADRLRPYAGRLCIPSIGPKGNVYDVAFRCIVHADCKSEGCPKYLFLPHMDKRLYNTRALARAGDTIEVAEGQLNAATLEACGLHAVSASGASSWKRHFPRLFQGFARVRVWQDGDDAGRAFANTVRESIVGAEVMMVESGHDVNDVYVEHGTAEILRIANSDTEIPDDDGWDEPPVEEAPVHLDGNGNVIPF